MKKILKNALSSWVSTLTGSIAGISQIREGVEEGNATKIILGVGLFILGLVTKED